MSFSPGATSTPVSVPDPEPPLGDLGDLVPVALDRVLMVDDVALDVEVRAVFDLDDPALAHRRDLMAFWTMAMRLPPGSSISMLSSTRNMRSWILHSSRPCMSSNNQRLADPQSLAIHLEHVLTAIVLDDVVIADPDHALAHLVPRGVAAFTPLLPSAQGSAGPPSPVKCQHLSR